MDLLTKDEHDWDHYTGESLERTVDYWGAILGIHDDQHVDVLYRWAPKAYCHFHRHLAPISSIVLQGEFHVYDYEDGKEVGHRIRQVGDYSFTNNIEDHIEQGGPDGALVMFSLFAPDGLLTQRLDDSGSVMQSITVDMLKKRQTGIL
ncbi:hypothetical protein [Sphingorhabdus sp. EL138]|uniref:hypothetical protein n=1 Tax=Sphingorhabdus sp. EL138 TaxID=2073156 RepID=UPI000D69FD48|nr:hypothetical protein [Sphingorhabdus sp. EL138]